MLQFEKKIMMVEGLACERKSSGVDARKRHGDWMWLGVAGYRGQSKNREQPRVLRAALGFRPIGVKLLSVRYTFNKTITAIQGIP